jgi:cell wall-associated NlpC family hydrolase
VVPTAATAMPVAPRSSPAHKPTIATVQKHLAQLALTNAQVVEKYDQALIAVHRKQKTADAAKRAAEKADTAFDHARTRLSVTATAMYEGGSFSATGALLSSPSGDSYLDRLQTLSMLSARNAQIVRNLVATHRAADTAKHRADAALVEATATRDKLHAKRAKVKKQLHKYKALLNTLTAAQRRRYLREATRGLSSSHVHAVRSALPHPTSSAAARAVHFALAQVGKPYVFGAAGPSSYDCSGLTMEAWAAAGVSLPHSAAGQFSFGHQVSFSQLQPGDLMFFYRPIGHVTIYIGDGYMVSAPETGENVSVVPANEFGSDFVGAVRL